MRVSIVGAGKVGSAVGFLLKKAGYEIAGFSCKTRGSLDAATKYLGNAGTLSNVAAVKNAETIIITTPDSRIAAVCDELANTCKGKIVLHMSGALGLEELDVAKQAGAQVFCAHPLQTFPAVDAAINSLPNSFFGVTASSKASMDFAKKFTHDLGGKPLEIPNEKKPIYHAAACIASNYLVALLDSVKTIGEELGLQEKALQAYVPLVEATLHNVETMGTAAALTGPIARGDIKTVKLHIERLSGFPVDLIGVYKSLGRQTVKIALNKGTISEITAVKMYDLLS